MANPELIPCLPFDIALNCLLRVPLHCHSSLTQVCRSWRSLVASPSFFQARCKLGYTDHYACLIQAIHGPLNSPIHDSNESPAKTPVYGITIFDSKLHSWHRLPPIPAFPHGLPLFSQFASVGCKLVLLGGWDPSSWAVLNHLYIYDFSSGQWKRGSPMPSSRSFFACASVGGTSVVVAGGHDDNKAALRTADIYNVESDEWIALPDMAEERDECKAVVMGGKLFVISGFSTELQGQFGSSAEVYCEEEKRWEVVENMWPAGIAPSSVTAMKGHLYACFESKLMRYRERDGQWENILELPRGMRGTACVTPLKEALFISGYTGGGQALEGFTCGVGTAAWSWQKVEADTDFLGIVQASCTMEV